MESVAERILHTYVDGGEWPASRNSHLDCEDGVLGVRLGVTQNRYR